jgi:hypothetical protein
MKEARVTMPELALIGGTRVALGAGIGLLLADRLTDDQRRAVGWTLMLIGAISTVPLAIEVLTKPHSYAPGERLGQTSREPGTGERLEKAWSGVAGT